MLCDLCQPIKLLEEQYEVHSTYPNTSYLKTSGDQGCVTCFVLHERYGSILAEPKFKQFLKDDSIRVGWTINNSLLLSWMPPKLHILEAAMNLVVKSEDEISCNGRWVGTNIHRDPISEECIDLALGWISNCQKNHEKCPGAVDAPLPKRVLDVGSLDGEQRIYLKTSKGEVGKYAALSYSWGTTQTLTTTLSTLPTHSHSIPFSTLPPSLQDAITITRKLAIRYLWIDALCIIQDSEQDWAEQSAAMYDIYGGASITISATMAKDTSESWLGERKAGVAPIKLWDVPPNPYLQRFVQEHKSVYLIPQVTPWDHNIDDAPLSKRGWALQERVLSPRVLHFGMQQMAFECQTEVANESGDFHVSSKALSETGSAIVQLKRILVDEFAALPMDISPYSRSANAHPSALKDRLLLRWYNLLCSYSRRNFTKESDKMPALLGILDFVRRKLEDENIAGLWRSDMHRGLCWAVVEKEKTKRPRIERAPSWSWVSVDGPMNFADRLIFDTSSEIVDIDVSVSSTRQYTGSLKLRTALTRYSSFHEIEDWKNSRGTTTTLFLDGEISAEELEKEFVVAYVGIFWKEHAEPDDVVNEYLTFSLILRGVGEEEGVFRRVGVVRVRGLWSKPTIPDSGTFEVVKII